MDAFEIKTLMKQNNLNIIDFSNKDILIYERKNKYREFTKGFLNKVFVYRKKLFIEIAYTNIVNKKYFITYPTQQLEKDVREKIYKEISIFLLNNLDLSN